MEGPEDKLHGQVSQPEDDNVRLGHVPEHVDLGTFMPGGDHEVEIAKVTLLNGNGALVTTLSRPASATSTPSAFRDQLGLDPEPALAEAERAAFELASPAMIPVTTYGVQNPPGVRLRFKPRREGRMTTLITMKVVGSDGSLDTRQIRVTGTCRVDRSQEAPQIVDELRPPDGAKALEGVVATEPARHEVNADSLESAIDTAKAEARRIVDAQADGVSLADSDIESFVKARVPPSLFDKIIEIAFEMGLAAISQTGARFFGAALGKILSGIPQSRIAVHPSYGPAPPAHLPNRAPSPYFAHETAEANDHLTAPLTDGFKEGFKRTGRMVRAGASGDDKASGEAVAEARYRSYTTEPKTAFIREQLAFIREHGAGYANVPDDLAKLLRGADPALATNVMLAAARAMATSAANADKLQANATKLQWVAALAQRRFGTDTVQTPEGSREVTKLDEARDYGHGDLFAATPVPRHDAILDIEVELPEAEIPVEESGFKVKSASILGVSRSVAETLRRVDLSNAGVPLRLVVSGHPALITRDELGRVRVNGYLLTKDRRPRWTQAQMHRGATLLMDRVLSRSLATWGVKEVSTNDEHEAK